MTTQTYYSPFFPPVEQAGAKGTTIAAVPSSVVGVIQDDIDNLKTISDIIEEAGYLDYNAPPQVTNLVLSSSIATDADGTQVATLVATWNKSTASDLAAYDLQIKENNGNYVLFSTSRDTTSSLTQSYQWSVRAAQVFTVQVRPVDKAGNLGVWSTAVTITSAKDTVPPAKVSQITVETSYETVFLTWDNPADSDLARLDVALHNSATNAVVRNMSVNGSASARGGATFTSVPKGTSYYARVTAFDSSGNSSGYLQSANFSTYQLKF